MRYQNAKPWKKRAAFTLIEILVVIAIIAILASLILAGVMGILYKGPEARTRNDILQLSTQLQKFHADKGFYPPDRFVLHANYNGVGGYNQANALDKESLYYIAKMWPNLGAFTAMAWAGPTGIPLNTGLILEGDQCLVFFLGGIPDANGKVTGFSNNPKNPTQAGGDRIKWYDFEAGRLNKFHGTSPFPSYVDGFNKKPYVYFNSGRRPDGYSNTNATLVVAPYIQTAGASPKYWNSTTFQLISAGLDGNYGPGGLWPSTPIPTAANDDYSNFHDRKLGSP